MKEFINALVATFFIYIIFPGCLVSQSQTFDNDLRENVYVQTDRDIYIWHVNTCISNHTC